jgi:uncharacterized protein (DUF2236 family)
MPESRAAAGTHARPSAGHVLRRVAGEPALLLGAPRALLMQLAHPKIAAAVDEHSDFRERPWLRLWKTLDPMVLLVFGTERQRRHALAVVRRTHDRVRGRLRVAGGPWQPGTAYSAHDRQAQAWVLLTLADTSEVVFERLVRGFHPGEREALWTDWRRLGLDFGIAPHLLPERYDAYRVRLRETLDGDLLEVTDTTRALAGAVLRPKASFLPAAMWAPAVSLTAGLLPPRLREAYGLRLGARERLEGAVWTGLQRLTWRLVPRARRALPRLYASARLHVGAGLASATATEQPFAHQVVDGRDQAGADRQAQRRHEER